MSLNYQVELTESGLYVLKITYPDSETIELDINDLYKDKSNILTLFDPINEYISTLPEANQKTIYEVFYKLYSHDYKKEFEDIEVVVKLENNIAKVSELLDYDNFKIWLNNNQDRIIYPDNILMDYIYDPDMNTTPEKTYIKRDYTNLIAMIMFLRALSPMYIDFYNYIRQITSHYYYKIFMLFVRSPVYESPEAEKLRTYIEVNQETLVGTTKNENLIISIGLSDDDILDTLLSEIVFNKLLTIDFFHKKCNIISFIFQTIRFKGSFNSTDGTVIRGKSIKSDPNKEDLSYFEDYRITSDLPIGTVVEIQHALSDINYLISGLGKENFQFDIDYYNQELSNIGTYLQYRLDKTQIYILGWFLNKIINPRALYNIEYRKLVELMLFAKTVMIQDGQDFVATLLSSYRCEESNYVNILIKNTVNKTLVKKLNDYYGFVMEEDQISIIEKTISEISKEITNNNWKPINVPEHLSGMVNQEGHLIIPNNINDVMYEYIEYINK